MKVILLKSVPKIGKKDDIVDVSDGFAANALFPKGLATPATTASIAKRDRAIQNTAATQDIRQNLLARSIEELKEKTVTMPAKANEQGKLFSKIDAKAIADFLLKEHRVSIDPKSIEIPGEHIKQTGSETITISEGTYSATLTITIK